MRRVRYSVAMSLDGYIADPHGGADWIIMDPEIDFSALFDQFDTFLLGRRTFEAMDRGGQAVSPGMKTEADGAQSLQNGNHIVRIFGGISCGPTPTHREYPCFYLIVFTRVFWRTRRCPSGFQRF